MNKKKENCVQAQALCYYCCAKFVGSKSQFFCMNSWEIKEIEENVFAHNDVIKLHMFQTHVLEAHTFQSLGTHKYEQNWKGMQIESII